MSPEYKNEYQKFADSAVLTRAKEEGFGRLRLGVFWGVLGSLGILATRAIGIKPPDMPKWMAMAIVATAPLAIVMLLINYIRLPNEHKASPQAIMIALITLVGAAATITLAKFFDLFTVISPAIP
jgi:hypothetical protein